MEPACKDPLHGPSRAPPQSSAMVRSITGHGWARELLTASASPRVPLFLGNIKRDKPCSWMLREWTSGFTRGGIVCVEEKSASRQLSPSLSGIAHSQRSHSGHCSLAKFPEEKDDNCHSQSQTFIRTHAHRAKENFQVSRALKVQVWNDSPRPVWTLEAEVYLPGGGDPRKKQRASEGNQHGWGNSNLPIIPHWSPNPKAGRVLLDMEVQVKYKIDREGGGRMKVKGGEASEQTL